MGSERRGRAVHGRVEVNPSGEEPTDRPRQKNAGLWEPYDGRLSRTVLREREGEVPSRHSPRQPRHLVKTLTWDQGREMARWPDIEATLGIEVYFCDPHSPWQRPTNEQTNGLLRRWLPKSTDLNVGAVRLAIIEDHLNTMPRKLHDWHSAHSVYAALCRNHR